MPKLAALALSIVCPFCALFAAGQDGIPKDPDCDFTIQRADRGKNTFLLNGAIISYDSCQRRLRLFPESALELKKARRCYKKIQIGAAGYTIFGFPALLAGAAAKGEGPKGGWATTTFLYLASVTAISLTYALIYNHHYEQHLARAISHYNAAITHTSISHPSNPL